MTLSLLSEFPQFAAMQALQIAEIAEALGVAVEPLLAACGLDRATLSDPQARVPLAAIVSLMERARSETGEPAFGVLLGMRARVTGQYGLIGFGLLAAKDMRQAIEFTCRYSSLRADSVVFTLTEADGIASLTFHERAAFGSVRDVVLLSLAIGVWKIGEFITGQALVGDLELVIPAPGYAERFGHLAPGKVHFDMPANALKFDARLLDLPLPAADAVSFRIASESCERELRERSTEHPVVYKLQALLQEERACSYTLPETARALGMSGRTLKRKLAEQRVSYSELIADARRRHALRLLKSEPSVEAVAERLGYSDPANFARAFRRWTGRTPSVVRRSGGIG